MFQRVIIESVKHIMDGKSSQQRQYLPDNYPPNYFFVSTGCGTGEYGMNENIQRVNLNCSQDATNQQTQKLSSKNLSTNSMCYQKHVFFNETLGQRVYTTQAEQPCP